MKGCRLGTQAHVSRRAQGHPCFPGGILLVKAGVPLPCCRLPGALRAEGLAGELGTCGRAVHLGLCFPSASPASGRGPGDHSSRRCLAWPSCVPAAIASPRGSCPGLSPRTCPRCFLGASCGCYLILASIFLAMAVPLLVHLTSSIFATSALRCFTLERPALGRKAPGLLGMTSCPTLLPQYPY